MFHFFDAITNTKGDALIGYFVQAIDPTTLAVVSIYADESSTPIVSASGVANMAKVDTDGNASFWIAPGTYHLDIYATDSTTFVKRIPSLPMLYGPQGAQGIQGPPGDVAKAADRTALAAVASPATGDPRVIVEAGREGVFIFDSSNLSAKVTADPLQGIYVPPSTDTTGASGAWVRKYSGALDPRWFGVTFAGYPTNDAVAMQAAINFSYAMRNASNIGYGSGAGPAIHIPSNATGRIYCGGTSLILSHTMRLFGDDTGSPSGSGSCLEWNGTCDGIVIAATATGAIVEGLTLKGGFTGTEGEFHGVKRLCVSTVKQCQFYDWPGDAVNDDENVGGGATNGSVIFSIYTENCRCSHKAFGGDANAGTNIAIQSKANRQAGVLQGGFLGDHYYSNSHNGAAQTAWNTGAAGHPASYCYSSGHHYYAAYGQETWCSTNAPSGTTASNTGWIYWMDGASGLAGIPAWFSGMSVRAGGAYVHTGLNNRSTFTGCYAEDNNPSQFDILATLVCSLMSAKALISGGVHYGEKDSYDGSSLRMVSAGSTLAFPVELGRTVIQSTSTSSTADLWNSQALTPSGYAGVRIQSGFESDGVTRLNVASVGGRPTSSNPATAEGNIEFQTRTFGGGGTLTTRFVYDGPSLSLRPDVDNTQDFGLTGIRWRNAYAYTVDAKTAYKVNGVTVLNGQMTHTTDLAAAPTAADFNALLAKLQAVGLMA